MPRKRVSKLDCKYAARKKREIVEFRRLLESEEERSDRLYAMSRRSAHTRAQESEEKRAKRLRSAAHRMMLRRRNESEEQRAKRLAADADYQIKKRASETAEERAVRLERNKLRTQELRKNAKQLHEIWLPDETFEPICEIKELRKADDKFSQSSHPVQLVVDRSPSPETQQSQSPKMKSDSDMGPGTTEENSD